LLADPSCLILDEPTSGLDSSNSLKITKILRKLASDGRIIIATIHQPSTLMFQEMDKLMVLGRGRTLYFGEANEIVKYMENVGVKVNYRMNPTDFLMLEISDFKNSRGYNTPMTA
jgi:ABC-type multidrug transport system ATPase subunit